MKINKLLVILIVIFAGINFGILAAQPSKQILVDLAHGQKFWADPAAMKKSDPKQIDRVKYMNDELTKIANSLNASIDYQKKKFEPGCLANCDLLFIHVPASKFSASEVKVINEYVQNGGSLFLAMDEDYWSTLKQTRVNELIKPFGIQYETQSLDTLSGGYTEAGTITPEPLKISYHGGRIVRGGTPFCYNNQSKEYPFGVFLKLENGGKLIVMSDGMVSLFMTSWKGVKDYQCSEFMHDVFKWLLN
ncbi:MAG: hypothetical protein Q7W54_15675 [Bacteroidota bacterium]|nr:hypothetical protein [Bacteroidota bacterium]